MNSLKLLAVELNPNASTKDEITTYENGLIKSTDRGMCYEYEYFSADK
jgi:hypothetical protein